mgnify:CR=1 FL=1
MRGALGRLSAQARSMLSGTLSTKRWPSAETMKSAAAIRVRSSRSALAGKSGDTEGARVTGSDKAMQQSRRELGQAGGHLQCRASLPSHTLSGTCPSVAPRT